MKTKKTYYFAVLLAVLAAMGFYFFQKANRAVAPVIETGEKEVNQTGEVPAIKQPASATTPPAGQPKPAPKSGSSTQAVFSDGSEMESPGPDVLVSEVIYDGTKFSPDTLNIKAGDIVFFKNLGLGDFWPASDPHPAHTAYPEFDAKKAVPKSGSFRLQFLKAGNWGYHDHLNPAAKGVINVAK